MEYYSSIKMNEVFIYTTWMTLENILRGKKLDIKGYILHNSIYKISRKSKLVETEVDQKLLGAAAKRYMQPNVHWSTVYNSQGMEAT